MRGFREILDGEHDDLSEGAFYMQGSHRPGHRERQGSSGGIGTDVAAEHMLDVEVLTPEGEVFEGEVQQVSTRTEVGEIGILANHAPLLAALQPTELRLHVSDSETVRYAQAHGWLQMFGNRARLLVEEAIAPEDLDAGALKDQLSDAEQRLSENEKGSADFARAQKDRDTGRGVPRDRRGMSEGDAGTPSAGIQSRAPAGAGSAICCAAYGAQ